ncbi:MAG: sugar ABC transporter ATP-binding protein [Succinatimonas hippei]|nr:sugar ABC transporter ATP-binding protein [Succinatimonas hippei]
MSQSNDIILSTKGLTKCYAKVEALSDVSLDIKRGEVIAICGENGAGKSTFIKMITGAEQPTSGSVEFNGKNIVGLSPSMVMNLGIAAVYQEFSLIPYLSIAENIFYGREPTHGGILNHAHMRQKAQALFDEMGMRIDVRKRIIDIGVAYQQMVEILKAVFKKPKFIILDEPTAPLTVKETKIFFNIVRTLKENGVTVLFISHRLEEVFEICDRTAVFMDGKLVCVKPTQEFSRKTLISAMVGREISDDYPQPKNAPGEPVLICKDLSNEKVCNVSFTLHKGEILGFGGLVGAGRTELARAIFGADPLKSGEIIYKGHKYVPGSPRHALERGIGLIPEDRKTQGVILGLSLRENVVFSSLPRYLTHGFIIDSKKERTAAERYVAELNIKTSSIEQIVKNLSGGNQQKVVLARILSTKCDVLIFDEPTRGIDVGAKQEIYNLMCRLADEGKSIIMVSSDMPELIGMSERICVMSEGRITAEFKRGEFSQEKILETASTGRGKQTRSL